MDFRDLQYVIAVADCGSITEAAKKLYIWEYPKVCVNLQTDVR